VEINVETHGVKAMAKERSGYTYQDCNGRWYARLTFTNEQGKRRDIKRRAESEKAAKKTLTELLREVEDVGLKILDASTLTFAQLSDFFQEHYLKPAEYVGEVKVSGVRSIVPALAALKALRAHFNNRLVRSITYSEIRSYKALRLKTLTRYDGQRSIASVNRELSKLKRLLNLAVQEQWLHRNPFLNGASLISAADEIHRDRVLSLAEEARLFAAINNQPKRAHLKGILLIALDCTLRRGEIFTLRWSDIDFERRTITVRAFNAKTARSRIVAMTMRVYAELSRLKQESLNDSNALVFGVSVTIKTAWKKICHEAGIVDFHFHDCRHTAITRLIHAGLPPVEVMRISGHTTLSCLYRYSNLESDTVFRAAAALDAYHAQNAEAQTTSAELIN
jgi:integrase